MTARTEDTALIRCALAYVVELYRELSGENGAPSLGTQNQAVDFICADPELSGAVIEWGRRTRIDEATTKPRQRLPCDAAYRRIAAFMGSVMASPVFAPKG